MDFTQIKTSILALVNDYEVKTGIKLHTIDELVKVLDAKTSNPKRRGAKSLRGLSL